LAKKRKRNGKICKDQIRRNNKNNKKEIILFTAAGEKVMVSDFTCLSKKRQKQTCEAFVHTTCIQEQLSLPLTRGACTVARREIKVKSPGKHESSLKSKKLHKRRRFSGKTEFVPASCITGQISQGYPNKPPAKQNKPVHPMISGQDSSSYEIILETGRRRRRKTKPVEFVPGSCITLHTAPVYSFAVQPITQEFVNPYPALPDLAPDITGGCRTGRARPMAPFPFIPESCITADVSKPYLPVEKTEEKPETVHRYIDRPNSPDILGPASKKFKRKRNNVVPFVPKSCTIDTEKPAPGTCQRSDVLAKPAPASLPFKTITKPWLPAAVLVLVVLTIIGYLLYK